MKSSHTGPRLIAGIVVGLTTVIVVMLLAFAAPAVNSGAHDLPLALSGPQEATGPVAATLEENQPGAFDITRYADAESAADAVKNREVIGAISVTPDGVTIQTAGGAGAPYSTLLYGVGNAMAAQGQQVTYADLAPLTDDDPTGAGITALGLPLIFGGLASAAALVLVYRGPVRNRVAAAVALSLAASFVATAILQFGFGSFDGSYWLTSLAVAAGIAAISLTALGLGLLLGAPGIGLAAVLMLFVANPLSGLAAGPDWLPTPWGELGQLLPLGAAGSAVRSAAFFDGNGATAAWVVLGAWIAVGLVFAALSTRRSSDATVSVPEKSAMPIG